MRRVGRTIIIRPLRNSGRKKDVSGVFALEANHLAALYDVPDSHIIVFDNAKPPAVRFQEVCAAISVIVASLGPGEFIESVIILCHGWKTGDQIGITTHNVRVFWAAFHGKIAVYVTVAFYSCSNGADTSMGPGGDGNLADVARDTLCVLGYVDCLTFGHLYVAHATKTADFRVFPGNGSHTGGTGGIDIIPAGHPQHHALVVAMRKASDPDGPGPEPMTSLRWRVPWMSEAEIIAELTATDVLVHNTGRVEPPSVLELQTALKTIGLYTGVLDGKSGRLTVAAVKAFQTAHPPLVVDGRPGPKTWASMHAAGLL